MGVVRTWTRSVLRRQWVAMALVAVVGAAGLGFSLVAAEGARRAHSAYTRLYATTKGPDGMIDGTSIEGVGLDRLTSLPGLLAMSRLSYTPVAPAPLKPGVDAGAFVGLDPDFMRSLYRPIVISGRLPRPGAPDEVTVNEALARKAHLRPGQRVRLLTGFNDPVDGGEALVVGVTRGAYDVGVAAGNAAMLLPPSFYAAHHDQVPISPQPAIIARFRNGAAGVRAFAAAAGDVAGHEVVAQTAGDDGVVVNRSLGVQSTALWMLAVVAATATLVAIGQAVGRHLVAALADVDVLVAFGMRPRRRLVLAMAAAAPVALVSAAGAMAVGIAASPLVPTGLARQIDPIRGVHADVWLLLAGVGLWVVLLAAGAAAVGWRAHRGAARPVPVRPSRLRGLVRSLPFRARLGSELALAPSRAPAGGAARSALIAAFAAALAVVGVTAFDASLHHLLSTPALQGWSFDAALSANEGPDGTWDTFRAGLAGLENEPSVRAVRYAHVVQLTVDGHRVEAFAFEPDAAIHPTLQSGRAPATADEIVLGADVAREMHTGIGRVVPVQGTSAMRPMRIVGIASYPELGNNSDIGHAASLTWPGAQSVGTEDVGGVALVRVRQGSAPSEVLARYTEVAELVLPFAGPRLTQLKQIGRLPLVLAAFLALLGATAVGHGLVRSARERRRDFAVLRTIGFRPRDVQVTMAWEGVATGLIGASLGVAGGVVLGPRVWSIVARGAAAVDRSVLPVGTIAAVIPVTIAVGCLVSLLPGWRASHQPTVVGLRSE